MERVFVIEIGRETRRGTMEVMVRKFIRTEAEQSDVVTEYRNRYGGLKVVVSEVLPENIETVSIPSNDKKTMSQKDYMRDVFAKEVASGTGARFVTDVPIRATENMDLMAAFDAAIKVRNALTSVEEEVIKLAKVQLQSHPYINKYGTEGRPEIDYSNRRVIFPKVGLDLYLFLDSVNQVRV